MLSLKDVKNTYWNGEGKHQKFVNEKLNNEKFEDLPIRKGLKKQYNKMAHSYYRFYNDGDRPRHKIFKNCITDKEISIILENKINEIIEEIQKNLV